MGAKLSSAHGKVGKRNLCVQRHGDHIADHNKCEPAPERGNRFIYDNVSVPIPEEGLAGYL